MDNTHLTSRDLGDVICAFPISGQYCFLQRLLLYLLLIFSIFGQSQEWLIRGSLAAAMTYSSSASVHAIVLAAISQKNTLFDLDVLGIYCVTSSSIIALGPTLDWFDRLRKSQARSIVKAWGVLTAIGTVCAFVALRRNYPGEKACFSHTEGLLRDPSQLIGNGFNCTYTCFSKSSPLRSPNEVVAVPKTEIFGSWYNIFDRFTIVALALLAFTILSLLVRADGKPWKIFEKYNIHWSWRGPRVEHVQVKINTDKPIAIKVLYGFLAPFGFIVNIILSEIYILRQPGLPAGEPFSAIGQWAPWVSAALVLIAATIPRIEKWIKRK